MNIKESVHMYVHLYIYGVYICFMCVHELVEDEDWKAQSTLDAMDFIGGGGYSLKCNRQV